MVAVAPSSVIAGMLLPQLAQILGSLRETFPLGPPGAPLDVWAHAQMAVPQFQGSHISDFAVYFTSSYLKCRHVHAALAALATL